MITANMTRPQEHQGATMMITIFFKSVRCHTFSKLQAQYEVNGDNKIFMQVYHESSNEEKAIGGLLMATQNSYLSNF